MAYKDQPTAGLKLANDSHEYLKAGIQRVLRYDIKDPTHKAGRRLPIYPNPQCAENSDEHTYLQHSDN